MRGGGAGLAKGLYCKAMLSREREDGFFRMAADYAL